MLNIANNSALNTARRMIPRNRRKTSEIYPAGGELLLKDKQTNPPFVYEVDPMTLERFSTTERMFNQRGMEEEAEERWANDFDQYWDYRAIHARRRRERDQYNAVKRNGYAV